VGQRRVLVAVGREAVVHGEHGLVGNDVAADATGDADRIEAFAIGQSVDVDGARLIGRQGRQRRCEVVDRVVAHP
jgi:hypothetical protein